MSAGRPQVRQGEQRYQLSGVLGQTPEAHFGVAELPFDHPEGCSTLARTCAFAFSILRLALYRALRLFSFLCAGLRSAK